MLFGRDDVTDTIAVLLAGAQDGRSGVLVVHGEAGIGKSAVLGEAARQAKAAGITVLRSTGVETEAELPFAGLHQFLLPLLDRLPALPDRQAQALSRAFQLAEPTGDHGDDRFLVGLAVLSLLADAGPVLCLIDDAQWLDSASADALLFASRRLEAEGVAMVFSIRDGSGGFRVFLTAELPEYRLEPLGAGPAGDLVNEHAPGLDPALRDRVLADAQGNPLALAELASAAADAGPTGSGGYDAAPGPLPASRRVRDWFASEIGALGEQARLALLVAAAEASGDVPLILAAGSRLGAGTGSLAPAELAGLITVTRRVEFRHPLIRSAAYYGAPLELRHAAHRALAAALESGEARDALGADAADRRSWHLAAAAAGPDEAVAAGLERAAELARERGGYAAAAAAYERAAQLTPLSPDSGVRAQRLLAAAEAATDVGQYDRVTRLTSEAERSSNDPLLRAEAARLRTHSYTGKEHDRLVALAAAVAAISTTHPERATELYANLLYSAWARSEYELAAQVIAAIRAMPAMQSHPANAVLLQRMITLPGDATADWPRSRAYLAQISANPAAAGPHERIRASGLAFYGGDHDMTWEISSALAAECRTNGMIGWLAGALQGLVAAQMVRGDWAGARASATEGIRLAGDVGQPSRAAYLAGLLAQLASLTGDEEACLGWLAEHERHGGPDRARGHYLGAYLGVLELSRSRFGLAVKRFEEAALDEWVAGTGFQHWPDLVEAAARDGSGDLARAGLAKFERWAGHHGQQWAAAVVARCRALVGELAGPGAKRATAESYAEAVRLHEGAGRPFEEARTRLVYGEWLRRYLRRSDAVEQLHASLGIFERLGAHAWAERARAELRATGMAGLRVREPGPLALLTPQEFQIARLAAAGISNRDIAAQLFLSHRTVGHHLYKTYPKLGITSRAELAAFFP